MWILFRDVDGIRTDCFNLKGDEDDEEDEDYFYCYDSDCDCATFNDVLLRV